MTSASKTFLWLYKLTRPTDNYSHREAKLPDERFCFNIMDAKWHVLWGSLPAADYRRLFNKQLLMGHGEMTRVQIEERICKYDTLTGQSYMAKFENEHSYAEDKMYAMMVESGIIDLKAAFQSCLGLNTILDNGEERTVPAYVGIHRNIRDSGKPLHHLPPRAL